MQPVRAAVAIAGALAMLCAASFARAQESIAEYAGIGHVLFCAQDIAELNKAAKLTPAQKEAAESLLRSAATQARLVWTRLMHSCQEKSESLQAKMSDPEAYQAATKDYMAEYLKLASIANKEIATIEREALTDLRGALKSDQVEKGWPAFERARRRLLLQNGWYMGTGRNPRSFLQTLKLSDADKAAAEEVLAHYEIDLDPLLVERMHGLGRMNTEMLEKGYDPNQWQTMYQREDLQAVKINKLNVKTAHAVEKALSDDGRRLFLRQRVGVEFAGYFQRPAADERVKQIAKLASLSDSQKDEIKSLITKADDAMFELALAGMRETDEAVLREETPKPEDVQTKAQERTQKAQAQVATLVKSLRAVLKPEQVEEIDFNFAQTPGQDPFKTDRSPPEESAWNTDPNKEPATAVPGGAAR